MFKFLCIPVLWLQDRVPAEDSKVKVEELKKRRKKDRNLSEECLSGGIIKQQKSLAIHFCSLL